MPVKLFTVSPHAVVSEALVQTSNEEFERDPHRDE
jgi:hypothetical protein